MIVDATKIVYFKDPPRSSYDESRIFKTKSRIKSQPKLKKEDLGIIVDATSNQIRNYTQIIKQNDK